MNVELKKYEKCLDEIRRRIDVIRDFQKLKRNTGFLITNVELICLQFRKIIELIALSSLVANKDVYAQQHKKFESHWNAKRIFEDLHKINSDFYPKPSTASKGKLKDGSGYFNLKPKKNGYLTQEDAIEIYDKASQFLHADNPFRNQGDVKKIESQFLSWGIKIINLMTCHCVMLVDGETMIMGQIAPDKVFVQIFSELKGVRKEFFEKHLDDGN